MATSSSKSEHKFENKKMNFFEIQSYLLKHKKDLICLYTECKPGFEVKFWWSNVKPLTEKMYEFLYFELSAFECRAEAECLIRKIEKFKGVYGIVKIVCKIVREVRDLLRGYELAIKPINPRSLFDLPARKVRKYPELERELYKADLMLAKDFNYSFKGFFKSFLLLGLEKECAFRKYEINFCEKMKKVIIEIENEESLDKKIKIARSFVKRCEGMKTVSRRKNRAIRKFQEFVKTYEKYL